MLRQDAMVVAILCSIAACGGSSAPKIASLTPPNPADNASCATLGIHTSVGRFQECQYVAVDPNAVSGICNEPNGLITIHTNCYANSTPSYCATCNLNPNLQGSWKPVDPGAKRLTADFDCQGMLLGSSTIWQCQRQTMTIFFTDDTNRTFSSTVEAESDPNNHLRPLELDRCNPPTMDTTLPAVDGSTAALSLSIPNHIFVPGPQQLQQAGATSNNPNAVSISLYLSRQEADFPPGIITGGTINIAATTFNPNQRLAFTIDATMAPPASDTQDGIYAIYCGQTGESSYGHWLGFVPSGG